MTGSPESFKTVILECLARVAAQRAAREADVALADRVHAIKRFQQRRFEFTYADLLQSARYREASLFFLNELYGPADFTDRDRQFERIVPKMVRMFPQDVLQTLTDLARLHADTEELDSAMAKTLHTATCESMDYVRAWQSVGRPSLRDGQLDGVLAIGRALDRFTQHRWLVNLLRMMRRPAAVAGLGRLQQFLETGMSAFCSMGGAAEFLSTVEQRERRLLADLFNFRPRSGSDVPGGLPDAMVGAAAQ